MRLIVPHHPFIFIINAGDRNLYVPSTMCNETQTDDTYSSLMTRRTGLKNWHIGKKRLQNQFAFLIFAKKSYLHRLFYKLIGGYLLFLRLLLLILNKYRAV